MRRFLHFLRLLPLALAAPFLGALGAGALWLTDACWRLCGRRRPPQDTLPRRDAASVVIPNWNGRELLERYLPSVVDAMAGNPANEVIVVDNGSTDGSVAFVQANFPGVRLLALERNLGFGGGSNHGFRHARNDIVVLLNSDMRVAPDFLQPLLDGFTDPQVFAVSCQIFFSDPARMREETGLTEGRWKGGALRVRHVIDPGVDTLFPCFYGGGGSCAFDRRKFLDLGGFDALLAPFYLEDTDLGYSAWKRGWKVFYQPASHVWHEHRGTIGRKFSQAAINAVLKQNFILFTWKNIHAPGRLLVGFFYALSTAYVSWLAGDSPERSSLPGLWRAFRRLPRAMRSRWRARSLAVIADDEAFLRPRPLCFRDRFQPIETDPARLSVVFVSPYGVWPPVHGGGVFMSQTIRRLGALADVHLIAMIDQPAHAAQHAELASCCASMEFVVRPPGRPKGAGSILPAAVREIVNPELEYLIHRQAYLKRAHVVQLEYTNLGHYALPCARLPIVLFEHDVYFQSIARALPRMQGLVTRGKAAVEYLRALRYELRMLPRVDRIQVCSAENSRVLLEYLPALAPRIDDGLRAGIDTALYEFRPAARRPDTLLFLGSFRHTPNQEALHWFLNQVLPRVLAARPETRLVVIGAEAPPPHTLPLFDGAVELVGYVDDVRQPLYDYSVFVCPILSGSGVRVKLLEAFAAGIPVVSTTLGAEGLANSQSPPVCALADTAEQFAAQILRLLADPAAAAAMARAARDFVVAERDMTVMTERLEQSYRRVLRQKNSA